jgi:hypothetical protein
MSPQVATRRRRLAIRLTGGALAWSAGLLVSALLLPVYNGQTVVDASGISLTTATYVERNGAWVLIPIALPALASIAVALAIARREQAVARWAWWPVGLLWAVGLVTVINAGGLLLPVALLLSLALAVGRRSTPKPARRRAQLGHQHELGEAPEEPRGTG